MSTIYQNSLRKKRNRRRNRSAAVTCCPQREGSVLKPRIVTPKKPNSARRPVAKAKLTNKKFVVAHIPGIGHNLRKHSNILVRGGGCRDLPGVRHTCVRGVLDFLGVKDKTKRRSVYGIKRPLSMVIKIRKKFRAIFGQ